MNDQHRTNVSEPLCSASISLPHQPLAQVSALAAIFISCSCFPLGLAAALFCIISLPEPRWKERPATWDSVVSKQKEKTPGGNRCCFLTLCSEGAHLPQAHVFVKFRLRSAIAKAGRYYLITEKGSRDPD